MAGEVFLHGCPVDGQCEKPPAKKRNYSSRPNCGTTGKCHELLPLDGWSKGTSSRRRSRPGACSLRGAVAGSASCGAGVLGLPAKVARPAPIVWSAASERFAVAVELAHAKLRVLILQGVVTRPDPSEFKGWRTRATGGFDRRHAGFDGVPVSGCGDSGHRPGGVRSSRSGRLSALNSPAPLRSGPWVGGWGLSFLPSRA